MGRYGIRTVVSGFGKELSVEEEIPYTLARTYQEHRLIRRLLKGQHFDSAMEVGCGYGRNLPLLKEFSAEVLGIERDPELCKIAYDLNPSAQVIQGTLWENFPFLSNRFQLLFTCTFLQHLKEKELSACVSHMDRLASTDALLLLMEETDLKLNDETTTGRSVDAYQELFSGFQLEKTYPRTIEATYPEPDSGTLMVFRKKE